MLLAVLSLVPDTDENGVVVPELVLDVDLVGRHADLSSVTRFGMGSWQRGQSAEFVRAPAGSSKRRGGVDGVPLSGQ